jgi:hypothetical protein
MFQVVNTNDYTYFRYRYLKQRFNKNILRKKGRNVKKCPIIGALRYSLVYIWRRIRNRK